LQRCCCFAQIVNHYRDELAATARFHRPITALYASLGVQLAPHWDLRAYEVHQLGASVEPGKLRFDHGTRQRQERSCAASAPAGAAGHAAGSLRQPHRGARRGAAAVPAARHASASALLSVGQRIDAEMGFVDPGANAVGFEIDACLPASGGEVTCANDAIAR